MAQSKPEAADEVTALEAAADAAAEGSDKTSHEEQAKPDPEADARAREASFLTHRPDDPGIDVNAEPEKPGRFRLF
jgi:HemY protein